MGKVNIGLEKNNNKGKHTMEKNKVKEKNKLEKIKQIKGIRQKKRKKIIIAIIAIILCALLATGIVFLVQNPPENWNFWSIPQESDSKQDNDSGNKVEQTKEEENQRKEAIKVALAKFKELGEDLKEKDLEVLRIKRDSKRYYYISSPQNTVEVSIETNKVTRLNGVLVDE